MKTSEDGIVEASLQPRILLVEPDQHLLNSRSLLLAKSNFRVLPADKACEVYHLRSVPMVDVAVLNDTLGDAGLRAAAQCVREQWRTARILILGAVQTSFEDYLYDEALDHRFEHDKLLDSIFVLCRSPRSEGYWTHPDAPKPPMNLDQLSTLPPAVTPGSDSRKENRGILSLEMSLNALSIGQRFARHNPT
jgi:hypothetical protein